VKMKGIIWCHWWRFYCSAHCTPALCCFSVMLYSSIHQWGPGAKPRQEAWGTESPRSWNIFLKYTAWNLRPGENKSHNLMPLVAFFIAVHTSIVLFQCHVAQYLASWGMAPCPPPPKSALVRAQSHAAIH